MTLPNASLTILSNGLGVGPEPVTAMAAIGASSAGTANAAPLITTDPTLIKSTFGQGPLVDFGCMLAAAGITVVLVKANTSTPGAAGAVTATRTGTSDGVLATTGNPNDGYEVIVTILENSTDDVADGVGSFSYSLDGGDSESAPIAIPSGGSYTVPDAGFALTFTNGAGPTNPTFEAGDVFTFTCTAPAFTTTDLADACAALKADPQRWRRLCVVGEAADSADSATLAATLKTEIETMATEKRFARAMMGAADLDAASEADADLKSAFANFTSERVDVEAGFVNWESASMPGRFFKRSAMWPAALRIATVPISEDLGRVKSGPIPRTNTIPGSEPKTALYRDEDRTPGLDAERFTTLRTIAGVRGYFITQGRLMAPLGSDFELSQLGTIMDVACETLYPALALYMNDDLVVEANGDLAAAEANTIKLDLENKLKDVLLRTTPQHVSQLQVTVIRDNAPLTTKTLKVKFRLLPKAYAKFVEGEIAYTASLESAA